MKKITIISVMFILFSLNVLAASFDSKEFPNLNQTQENLIGTDHPDENTCESQIGGLKSLVQACKDSGYHAKFCIDKYWPLFKLYSPQCIMAGAGFCVDQCKIDGYDSAFCADYCININSRR